jgi:PEP-CTERM motif
MRHRNSLGILLCCAVLLAVVQPAKADTMDGVTLTLTSPDLAGSPGDTLVWNYKLINNNPDGLGVLVADVNAPAGFSGGIPLNFLNMFGPPPLVAHGATQTGTLYEFSSDPTVPNSINRGMFQLDVVLQDSLGTDIVFNEIYSATITSSTNVAEPGTLMLLASGLLAGFLVIRRAAH